MYSKFPVKFVGITDNFGMRKHPISGVSTKHYGLDLGWINYKGEPIICAHDGKVVTEGYDSGLGNYIVICFREGNNIIINRYLHLKNRALVKKGMTVKQGIVLGYMGETGYADGVHLHFEYWICPNNYAYKSSDVSKYAVNPLKYCYLFDDQKVTSGSLSKVKKVVGSPVSRNKGKNQIRVVSQFINCRGLPSLNGKILGYINLGYYNVFDTKTSGGYTWYKIASGKWVANVLGHVKEYFVVNDKENSISSSSLSDVNSSDTSLNEINGTSTNEDSLNIFDNYDKFVSTRDDYYYIYLKEGESIYFPK